jgi:phosphoribosylformimino-5-aminoimidazole carboxamide ribotide isomerase
MKLIPVIDLMNGVVVHARQGNRQHYQPIHSDLCKSPDIYRVVKAFLELYDFDVFYIADLNAIARQGSHDVLLKQVLRCFPNITFWIDRGYQRHVPRLKYPGNTLPVLGSESYRDDNLADIKAFDNNFILSLDYSAGHALGANRVFSDQEYWPDDIIIMTLELVGSGKGPAIEKLKTFCGQYPAKNFIAAGGIRDKKDVSALHAIGIKQVLLASALHSGKITGADIAALQTKKYPGQPGYF